MPDDVLRARADQLAALARQCMREAAKRAAGAIHVSWRWTRGHETVLVGINDDRPFLFDSALLAAMAGGARIRAAFHPIIDHERGRHQCHRPGSAMPSPARPRAEMLLDALRGLLRARRAGGARLEAMLARLSTARDQLARPSAAGRPTSTRISPSWTGWRTIISLSWARATIACWHATAPMACWSRSRAAGWVFCPTHDTRVIRHGGERAGLTAEVRAFSTRPSPSSSPKRHSRSLVHRRTHMDYIGIKTFDANGAFAGERRFVGLFTSDAYSLSPRAIPLLRRKIEAVMAHAGLAPASHDGKALTHILDTFPRDELFQISADELFVIAMGILHLGGLPRLKLFLRFDRFDRFVSALLLAPRDHINPRCATHPCPAGQGLQRPHLRLRRGDRRQRAGADALYYRPQ